MFRVDPHAPSPPGTTIVPIRFWFLWSAFHALVLMQGAAGSVPAGGTPRLLPSPRRPLSERGSGTARRWYTAGLSALRLFFLFLFLGWRVVQAQRPGNWGNDFGETPFPISPFCKKKGTRSGAEGPRRWSGWTHRLRHQPGIRFWGTKRRWAGQHGPTSGAHARPPVDPTGYIRPQGTRSGAEGSRRCSA